MQEMTIYPASADLSTIFALISLGLFLAVGALVYVLVGKQEEFKELQESFKKIMASFDELDEQAKLIVKTDLELNKTQEELDRRLTGLNTLQKLSKKMSMTLDENELFKKIDAHLIAELGFSRMFAATYTEENGISLRGAINFDDEEGTARRCEDLIKNADTLTSLEKGLTLSSLSSFQKTRLFIAELFDTEHFILAPLLTQRGLSGALLFGNPQNAPAVTEGDEEIIAILASQLAQSIENSQLFEQVYRSSQMLETKVNERTRELTNALKDVEEISKKKSEFISAVSHELRTPLTSIKGYASILMTGKIGDIPDAVKERLGKINLHSDNLVKLINDLLDISRIESGRVEMKTTKQPIKPILENMADLLTPQLQNKGVTLKLDLPADMPEIEFDQSQLERVFINLVSNAIKFTDPGGNITINAHIDWDKQTAIFEVADSGIGISKEDLSRIFDEFFRVDNQINMSVKGTGLGLALAKNIVEAHNGKMWVTSEVGVGTTFHFQIPFEHRHKDEITSQPQSDK